MQRFRQLPWNYINQIAPLPNSLRFARVDLICVYTRIYIHVHTEVVAYRDGAAAGLCCSSGGTRVKLISNDVT